MMSVAHLLEDFSDITNGNLLELSDVQLEEEKLKAFEKGYQAGLDDSSEAHTDAANSSTSRLVEAIADLTNQVAIIEVALAEQLRPLFCQIIDQFLPEVAAESLAPRVQDALKNLLTKYGKQPVTLRCSAQDFDVLQTVVRETPGLSINVTSEDNLSSGQVQIGFGSSEEQALDHSSAIQEISQTITRFFDAQTVDLTEAEREVA